ncbi:MAG TPA: hypothetical protein VKP68_06885, partial [Ramlibacter sp.]|nr:hypothetical protein [Ramlibacter sp.]
MHALQPLVDAALRRFALGAELRCRRGRLGGRGAEHRNSPEGSQRAGRKHCLRRVGISHEMPPLQRAGLSRVALRTKPAG